MKKVIVIGSNSFTGAHFVNSLLDKNEYNIIGLSRSEEKSELYLPYLKNENKSNFKFIQADMNKNIDLMINVIDDFKPDYIVNFASQSMVGQSWNHPEHWYNTNVLSLVKFIDKLKDRTFLKKYVHITTPEVYGTCKGWVDESNPHNPSTPYAASRSAGDIFLQMYVKECGFPAVFTRAANVFGPHQQLFKIIPRAIIYMKSGKKVPLHGGGCARRAFIHVKDVCECTIDVMEKALPGNCYHISTNELISIRNLVHVISQKMNVKFENAIEDVECRKGLDDAYILDSTKANIELGWKPEISFEDALQETIDWVNNNWSLIEKEEKEYIHKE
jgi:dTDP-glucose 4,6-dehydratase